MIPRNCTFTHYGEPIMRSDENSKIHVIDEVVTKEELGRLLWEYALLYHSTVERHIEEMKFFANLKR